jgi:hypothetical protein
MVFSPMGLDYCINGLFFRQKIMQTGAMSKAGSVSGIPGQLPLTGMMVTEPWHPGIGERVSKVGTASDGVNQ